MRQVHPHILVLSLTHPPMTKWPTFWQTDSDELFMNENGRIPIQISLEIVPESPIDNIPALAQVMGLAPNRRQAITSTNEDPVHGRIYAALVEDELNLVNYRSRKIKI